MTEVVARARFFLFRFDDLCHRGPVFSASGALSEREGSDLPILNRGTVASSAHTLPGDRPLAAA